MNQSLTSESARKIKTKIELEIKVFCSKRNHFIDKLIIIK